MISRVPTNYSVCIRCMIGVSVGSIEHRADFSIFIVSLSHMRIIVYKDVAGKAD